MIKLFSKKDPDTELALTGQEPGTPTGILALDDAINGGLKPGQLVILAGPTGSGKSALASQIALSAGQWAAERGKGNVLYFSYEMNKAELMNRLLLQATPELRDGYHPPLGWSERDKQFIAASLEQIRSRRIRVEDKAPGDISAVIDLVKRDIKRTGRKPCLVIVDQLGLIGSKGAKSDVEAMGGVARALKSMARSLAVPVLALSQFSRQVDSDERPDHELRLSDLRASSSIEQYADLVLLLHAPYLYYKDKEERKRLVAAGAPVTLMVAKNRSGPTVDIELKWIGPRVTFR